MNVPSVENEVIPFRFIEPFAAYLILIAYLQALNIYALNGLYRKLQILK